MRNYYNHSKLFLLLGALAIALLIQGVIHLYREVETFGAEHRYTTSHVTYGTQSKATAMPPMVQSPSLRRTAVAVPMASSSVVHSTPYTTRSTSSSFTIHTTSSAQVRYIGSGGGSGAGGGIATTNGVGSSRRGMTYSNASVSMPTLALAKPHMATDPSSARYTTGPMRKPGYDGDDDNPTWVEDIDGWWYWDEGEWVSAKEGDTKIENGIAKIFKDGKWVEINDQADPYVPVGPMPWLFMAVLSAAYVVVKSGKLKVKS